MNLWDERRLRLRPAILFERGMQKVSHGAPKNVWTTPSLITNTRK